MTTKPPPGKPTPTTPRHPYGPRPIGALLPAITRPAFRAAGPAAAQLMADWPAIVGPALAATAAPRRFAAGTLTIACAGPVALELQHLASQLIERINTHLGRPLVQRLRFIQAPPRNPPNPNRRPEIHRPRSRSRESPKARCETPSPPSAARSGMNKAVKALDGGGPPRRIQTLVVAPPRIRMQLSRRSTLIALASAAAAAPAAPRTAWAQPADPRMAERALGPADAKITVHEWFSLTCSHCAEFQKKTFPQVRKDLIDPGRIRYVWRDYPLDQVALTAAMVARALPPERYEPFITTLLATQDRWAFTRGVNSTEELAKLAALAGMPRQTFDTTIADAGLKQAILAAQDDAEKTLKVQSTPSFIINGKLTEGAVPYPAFLQAVDAAQA